MDVPHMLPTNLCIEEMMQFFIFFNDTATTEIYTLSLHDALPICYGVFSVSHSGVGEVAKYIAQQEEHHRKRSYSDELRLLLESTRLKSSDDHIVDTVSAVPTAPTPC